MKGYHILDGNCTREEGILPGQSCGGTIKCDFDDDGPTENPAPIIVESGNFHDIKDKDEGGAMKLVNHAIQMKNAVVQFSLNLTKKLKRMLYLKN